MPPGVRESMLGYHSCNMKVLTCTRESGWGTLSGGQFDWGGRLLKGNGGVQRLVYAFALVARFPSVLNQPLNASVTF